jgi:hypothetical protein
VQTVMPGSTKIADAPFARGFGEYDLWDLWLLDEAEDVPCESIRTFIYYLCSRGTKHCEILNDRGLTTGSVDVRLTGPLADDERNHLLRYRLTRVDIAKLKEAEKNLLVAKLIKHYPTQDDELHQEVCRALKAVGLSLA